MGKEIGTLQAAVVADYMASNLVANVSEKNEKVKALAVQIAMRNAMFTAQEGQIDAMRGQAEMQLQGLLMSQRNNAAPALEVKMRVIENKKGYAYETIRSDVNSYYNNYIAECQQLNEVIEKDYKDGCIIANQNKISNDIFALDTQLSAKLTEFESAIKAADQAEDAAQKEVDEKLQTVQSEFFDVKNAVLAIEQDEDYKQVAALILYNLANISTTLEGISKRISEDKEVFALADLKSWCLANLQGLSDDISTENNKFLNEVADIKGRETNMKTTFLTQVDSVKNAISRAMSQTVDNSAYSDSKYDAPKAEAKSAFEACLTDINTVADEINAAYEAKNIMGAEEEIAGKIYEIENRVGHIEQGFFAKVAEIDATPAAE